MRRSVISTVVVLGLIGLIVMAVWPRRVGTSRISVVAVGSTNASGIAAFVVGITNHSEGTMECLVGRASGTWRGRTALAQEQRVVLPAGSGVLVAVPMPRGTNGMGIAVIYRRSPGVAEKGVRALGGRLGLCEVLPDWEEMPLIAVQE